jgi:chorismate mutase
MTSTRTKTTTRAAPDGRHESERTVASTPTDPVITQFRDQISDNDLKIVDAMNKRLKLVKQLKAYKEQHGVDFYDPAREEWMLTFLARANKGPLTNEGLRDLFTEILALTKEELAPKK